MKLIPIITISLGILGTAFGAESDGVEYEIVGGKLVVFGHELVPHQALPDFGSCEECQSFHSVDLVRSPDIRRVLIISDVHLANFDAWVFDTQSDSVPVRIAKERRGRHLTRSEWHSNIRIELSFAGMGYSTSIFIDVSRPDDSKIINDPLLYDAERDCSVRYVHDADTGTDLIEIGTVFAGDSAVERFPVALDNEFLSDSLYMFEKVEIDGPNLIVTYKTSERGMVRDVFQPKLLLEEN